jgi:hypothetical protein
MIKVTYNTAILTTNAPHGINPHASALKWATLARRRLESLCFDVEDVCEDSDQDEAWYIYRASGLDWREIDRELTVLTESDEWLSYEREQPDYEYMGGR